MKLLRFALYEQGESAGDRLGLGLDVVVPAAHLARDGHALIELSATGDGVTALAIGQRDLVRTIEAATQGERNEWQQHSVHAPACTDSLSWRMR